MALCTHNGARFIAEQIGSICNQSRACAQLVISDDASSDDCIQIARSALAGSPRPLSEAPGFSVDIIVNPVALRVTKNFEQAVSRCTGELIALCDQDDIWHPDYIARMREQFELRPGLLLLHCNARRIDAAGGVMSGSLFETKGIQRRELIRFGAGEAAEVLMRRNIVTGAATVIRRRLLQHALPFPAEWLHDEWLAVVAAAIGEVDVLDACLIDYRQHDANQVGAMPTSLLWKVRKAFSARDPRLDARVRKVAILLDRLKQLGPVVSPGVLELVQLKLAHQRFRAGLPRHRIARWPRILRELSSGRYNRFGLGLQTLARDLFESG